MNAVRRTLATFERPGEVLDHFIEGAPAQELVCRAWVSAKPLSGREVFNAQQVQSIASQKYCTIWTQDTAKIDTGCRMKFAKPEPVKPDEPNHDDNFRVFQIESIVNVGERNRELEMMVVERT